ncbi:MAG: helix-turn-helix domain-containing protein [Chloroflexi bacterium]|nr:helix-turn-helix domain-containing protein [Chloroflexota bacterium]
MPATATPAAASTLFVKIRPAARESGIPARTLYELVAQGKLKVLRSGRTIYIPRDELNRIAREGANTAA